MLSINLLPEEKKKIIGLEKWRRLTVFFAVAIAIILIFGEALLLPSFLPLFFEKRELNRFTAIEKETRSRLKVDEDLQTALVLKKEIDLLQKLVTGPTWATPLLADVLALQNFSDKNLGGQVQKSGVELLQISVTQDGRVTISGLVKNRRDLLDFEGYLRSLGWFSDIYSPLSGLVRGATDFSIQARLKPGQL